MVGPEEDRMSSGRDLDLGRPDGPAGAWMSFMGGKWHHILLFAIPLYSAYSIICHYVLNSFVLFQSILFSFNHFYVLLMYIYIQTHIQVYSIVLYHLITHYIALAIFFFFNVRGF